MVVMLSGPRIRFSVAFLEARARRSALVKTYTKFFGSSCMACERRLSIGYITGVLLSVLGSIKSRPGNLSHAAGPCIYTAIVNAIYIVTPLRLSGSTGESLSFF